MDAQKEALVERFRTISRRMGTQMQRSALQESLQDLVDYDLTMPQMRTLGFLAPSPQRMGEVAGNLGISVSSATSLVERLEGKGLVQRQQDPHDRRVVLCHLTTTGKEVVERFWERQRFKMNTVAELLTVAELHQVVEAFELLVRALDRTAPTLDPIPVATRDCPGR